MPSSSTDLEPGEVAAERGGAQDSARVLLELLVGEGLLDGDRIIRGGQCHVGDPDSEHRVRGRGVSVVGVLGGIAPCFAPVSLLSLGPGLGHL